MVDQIAIVKIEHSVRRKGFALGGPALGRPSKEKAQEQKQLEKLDAAQRNEVEGKFEEGKRHYGMGLISAHLQETVKQLLLCNY